jgi:hypothetical protein
VRKHGEERRRRPRRGPQGKVGRLRRSSAGLATDAPCGNGESFTFSANRCLSCNDPKRIEEKRYRMISGSNLLWLILLVSTILVGSICGVKIANYSAQIDFILDFFDKGWHE